MIYDLKPSNLQVTEWGHNHIFPVASGTQKTVVFCFQHFLKEWKLIIDVLIYAWNETLGIFPFLWKVDIASSK